MYEKNTQRSIPKSHCQESERSVVVKTWGVYTGVVCTTHRGPSSVLNAIFH